MIEDGHVLVIGSAGIDIKGRPPSDLTPGIPNLGMVQNSVGGVARNIAENLARLEVPVTLISAVGRDVEGARVLRVCERAGVDVRAMRRVPGLRTGTYMALLHPDGQLNVAISDFDIIRTVDTKYILQHEALFDDALMVVVDATLEPDVLVTICDLATQRNIPIAADPTNPMLAGRLCPLLNMLYLIVPNASETGALCGLSDADDRDSALETARALVAKGVKIAVVTLGPDGLVYAHGGGVGYVRAIQTRVVDATGAGDAFTGAMLFGVLNDVPLDEAMRLGATAASLTLRSRNTVLPNLSQELLYDELMA
ncbi:MAG: carbohydrate kinase family protein [Chloroflexota bacterium]